MKYFISKNISIIYRFSQIFMARRLKPYDIGSGQHSLILTVAKNPGQSQEDLALRLGMDKGTITRLVQKLEEKDFLRRQCSEQDKRINCVYPTAKSLAMLPVIEEKVQEWYDVILADFSMEQRLQASRLLEKMAENVMDYVQEEVKK